MDMADPWLAVEFLPCLLEMEPDRPLAFDPELVICSLQDKKLYTWYHRALDT